MHLFNVDVDDSWWMHGHGVSNHHAILPTIQYVPLHIPFKFLTRKTGFIFHPHISFFCLGFNNSGSVAKRHITQGAAERHPGDTERVFSGSDVMWPMAHDLLEHFSKACWHEVVQDWVDCWAKVEKHSGDDVHVLEDFQLVVSPVNDKTPHETVSVKRGPADPKHHH